MHIVVSFVSSSIKFISRDQFIIQKLFCVFNLKCPASQCVFKRSSQLHNVFLRDLASFFSQRFSVLLYMGATVWDLILEIETPLDKDRDLFSRLISVLGSARQCCLVLIVLL